LIWVAPVVGPNSATGYQLGIGYLMMPLGRFMRRDPSPRASTSKAQPWGFRSAT
jgi:hypothetical protein